MPPRRLLPADLRRSCSIAWMNSPATLQVQLAEFLARRPATWRLIATAAVPLGELARRGNFRADLAALLSTITIELPPLAQRRDDLPLLAQLFLEEHNAAGPRQIGDFSPAALDRLDAYAWPGNLDELAQVVAEAYAGRAGRRSVPATCPNGCTLRPGPPPSPAAPMRPSSWTSTSAASNGS